MIVGARFENDGNDVLQLVQHDCYRDILYYIFECAKTRFLESSNLLGVRNEIIDRLRDRTGFDHRVLQNTHDIIAARYRYLHDDGGQLSFFDNPKNKTIVAQKEFYKKKWCDWFYSEVKELNTYDEFTKAVVKAVIYQNTETGYLSESVLKEFLQCHYWTNQWAFD